MEAAGGLEPMGGEETYIVNPSTLAKTQKGQDSRADERFTPGATAKLGLRR
jgi:hypothetical protein